MMKPTTLNKNDGQQIWYPNLELHNPAKFKFSGSPQPKKSMGRRIAGDFDKQLQE